MILLSAWRAQRSMMMLNSTGSPANATSRSTAGHSQSPVILMRLMMSYKRLSYEFTDPWLGSEERLGSRHGFIASSGRWLSIASVGKRLAGADCSACSEIVGHHINLLGRGSITLNDSGRWSWFGCFWKICLPGNGKFSIWRICRDTHRWRSRRCWT